MRAIYRPAGAALEYAPLAVNLYQSCPHRCGYCYAPKVLHTTAAAFHAPARPRAGILDALRKDAPKHQASLLPVLVSFIGDCYPSEFDGEDVTRDAISILCDYKIPVHVLTKGGMRAARDFDLLRQNADSAFGTTLVFLDDQLRATWEPGAASVAWRIEAIRLAHSLGIPTWVSLEPVIDPKQALWLIQDLSHIVDEWRVGKLNHMEPPEPVDWHEWAPRLVEALDWSGRHFLIKESLRPYLPAEMQRRARWLR